MKGKLLFLIPLLFFGPFAEAQPLFEDGDYYIQEITTGYYLSGGLNWGTQASLLNEGDLVNIKYSEGSYTLDYSSVLSDNETRYKYLGIINASDIYIDRYDGQVVQVDNVEFKASIDWKIERVQETYGDDSYTIRHKNFGYLSLTGGTDEQPVKATTASEDAAIFRIIQKDQISDYLASNYPINATCLIGDPNFSRCHSSAPWTGITSEVVTIGGRNENYCIECWRKTFDVNQVLVDIPNGIYMLKAQAALTDYAGLYNGADYPVVYANSSTSIFSDMEYYDRGSNMSTMSASFSAGKYYVDSIVVLVEDHTLTVGVRGTREDTWAIWDNFTLTYLAPLPTPDQKLYIGPSGYATFYSSQSVFGILNTSDTEVYLVNSTSGEGTVMSMNLVYIGTTIVPKGVGVIIKGVPNTEYTLTATDIPTPPYVSILEGCDAETEQDENFDYYTLDVKDGSLLFGRYDSSKKLKANKAFYRIYKDE